MEAPAVLFLMHDVSFDEHRKGSYRSVFGVSGREDCRVIQACF